MPPPSLQSDLQDTQHEIWAIHTCVPPASGQHAASPDDTHSISNVQVCPVQSVSLKVPIPTSTDGRVRRQRVDDNRRGPQGNRVADPSGRSNDVQVIDPDAMHERVTELAWSRLRLAPRIVTHVANPSTANAMTALTRAGARDLTHRSGGLPARLAPDRGGVNCADSMQGHAPPTHRRVSPLAAGSPGCPGQRVRQALPPSPRAVSATDGKFPIETAHDGASGGPLDASKNTGRCLLVVFELDETSIIVLIQTPHHKPKVLRYR